MFWGIVSYWVEWHCDNFTEKYIQTIIGEFVIKSHEFGGTLCKLGSSGVYFLIMDFSVRHYVWKNVIIWVHYVTSFGREAHVLVKAITEYSRGMIIVGADAMQWQKQ